MAAQTIKKMSIYEKLMLARIQFGMTDKTKSGKNPMGFKYYELSDIVPIATKVFHDLGMAYIVSIEDNEMVGVLHDYDSGEEIKFKCPFVQVADPGKLRGMTEVQSLGASCTYIRRYLYFIALDIVDPDAFDAVGTTEDSTPKAPKSKAPATVEKRAEVKAEVTKEEPNASPEQIAVLKSVLKAYKTPETEEEVQKIVTKTNKFTQLTSAQAEALIKKYSKKGDNK